MKNKSSKGIFLAVLACFFWGSAFVAARYLVGETSQCDPYSLVFYRYAIGGIILMLWAKINGYPLSPGNRQRCWSIFKVSFFLYWLMAMFFFVGTKRVSATTASLFIESGPALMIIIGRILSRRAQMPVEPVAALVALLGSMLVLNIITTEGFQLVGNPIGILFVFISACSWICGGIYNHRLMDGNNAVVTTAWCEICAAMLTIPVLLVMHNSIIVPSTSTAWLAILAMGIFPTAIAFALWSAATPMLPLWQLNMTQNLTPAFTMIMAYFLIDEKIKVSNALGILVVILGLSIAALLKKEPQPKK